MTETCIEVVNLSDNLPNQFRNYDEFYIDRRSALGNPFELKDKADDVMRDKVVKAYAKYLWMTIKYSTLHSEGKSPLAIAEHLEKGFNTPISKKWIAKSWSANDVLWDLKELFSAAQDPFSDGLVLKCWCSPSKCHGDVLIRVIEWYLTQDQQARALACRLTAIQMPGSRF
jgi:hypothetical protein